MENTIEKNLTTTWDDDATWSQEALCGPETKDPEVWFPERTGLDGYPIEVTDPRDRQVMKAQQACGRCAVQLQCLQYALKTGQSAGIWGGMTTKQRNKIGSDKSPYELLRIISKQNDRYNLQ